MILLENLKSEDIVYNPELDLGELAISKQNDCAENPLSSKELYGFLINGLCDPCPIKLSLNKGDFVSAHPLMKTILSPEVKLFAPGMGNANNEIKSYFHHFDKFLTLDIIPDEFLIALNFISENFQEIKTKFTPDNQIINIFDNFNSITKENLPNFLHMLKAEKPGAKYRLFLKEIYSFTHQTITKFGYSINIWDLCSLAQQDNIRQTTHNRIFKLQDEYNNGLRTWGEVYNSSVDVITNANESVYADLKHSKPNLLSPQINSLTLNKWAISRLFGVSQCRIHTDCSFISLPFSNNLVTGSDPTTLFYTGMENRTSIRTKAQNDKYITAARLLLAHFLYGIKINEDDCRTSKGYEVIVADYHNCGNMLEDQLLNRYLATPIYDSKQNKLFNSGDLISQQVLSGILENQIPRITIRSPAFCQAKNGICQTCSGLVETSTYAGVVAAKKITESFLMNMPLFYTFRISSYNGPGPAYTRTRPFSTYKPGKVKFQNIETCIDSQGRTVVTSRNATINIITNEKPYKYEVPYGAILTISDGATIEYSSQLYINTTHSNTILAGASGRVKFLDFMEGYTIKTTYNSPLPGIRHQIRDTHSWKYMGKKLNPRIVIEQYDREDVVIYMCPGFLISNDLAEFIIEGDAIGFMPIEDERKLNLGVHGLMAGLQGDYSDWQFAPLSPGTGHLDIVNQKKCIRSFNNEIYDIDEKINEFYFSENDFVHKGDRLSDGPNLSYQEILSYRGKNSLVTYVTQKFSAAYAYANAKINPIYLEILIKGMIQKDTPEKIKFIPKFRSNAIYSSFGDYEKDSWAQEIDERFTES